jgi:nucleoside-diphosphate-sugar epimerase
VSRRALVIGAGSFLGRALSQVLDASWDVVHASSRPGQAALTVDLREVTSVRDALATVGPDVTFCLAAPQRDASTAEALGLVPGILALLEATPGLVVLTGSAAEYGARDRPQPLREDAPLRPRGPYATAKATQTMLARGIGGRVAVARLFNLIGPGQQRGFVASDLIARHLAGEDPLLVRGAGSTRDLVDVRDAASALALIADRDFCGEVNVGSGIAVSVADIAGAVCEALGGTWSAEPGGSPDDHSVASVETILALGWRPTHDWRSSLAEQARASVRATSSPG